MNKLASTLLLVSTFSVAASGFAHAFVGRDVLSRYDRRAVESGAAFPRGQTSGPARAGRLSPAEQRSAELGNRIATHGIIAPRCKPVKYDKYYIIAPRQTCGKPGAIY